MRKSSSRKTSQPGFSPLACDIAGILVLTLGVISLVSLASPAEETGEIGRDLAHALRLISGAGAYIVPVLAFIVGAMLLFGGLRVRFTRRTFAAVALWLIAISWLHVANLEGPPTAERVFSPEAMAQGGGYLGAGLSYFLLVALGRTSALALLGGLALAAVIVITDIPVFSTLGQLLRRGREDQPASAKPSGRESAARGREKEERKKPEPGPAPQPAPEPAVDRQALIERAIQSRRQALEEDLKEAASAGEVIARPSSAPGNGREESPFTDEAFDDEGFVLPPVSLLDDSPPTPARSAEELSQNVEIIERTLQEFNITANVVEIAHGPTVTRYEIQLAAGIRVNKIVSLADNIAMSLAAINVRVEAPIPGKSAIGVEVPNRHRGLVGLKDVIETPQLRNHPSKLAFPLGLDVAGEPVVADLCSMPHLLVAGATNMGKSIMLNSLISSLLLRTTPRDLRLVLIDPKRVELSLFDGIPHLCAPVIRDAKSAAGILRAAVQEMDRRYDKLAAKGTRNIASYNESVGPRDRLPYLVIVIDELADLMMQAAADVEASICRIAQLARAVGIHLVIATQRPSVDVVTGTIKANIASRIAFAVSSQVDSRTILDQNGAERLIGKGDMLFRPIDAPKPVRIQGAYVSEQEVKRLVDHLREQGRPEFSLKPVEPSAGGDGEFADAEDAAYRDEFYEPAVRLVVSQGRASTSMIQRRFRIGYTRAARLVDAMEKQGIVGPADGANPREVLLSPAQMDELFGLPQGTTAASQDYDEDEE
ncbi:MAG: DNA translocase FtsK 4TM domain-containing protein [Armatimonadota bacterium]|jgi:S-DNA-T family DNA segregation ATPase FtsK/SpoIIIE